MIPQLSRKKNEMIFRKTVPIIRTGSISVGWFLWFLDSDFWTTTVHILNTYTRGSLINSCQINFG